MSLKRRIFDICLKYCTKVYIIWSLDISNKNILVLCQKKKKREIYVGFNLVTQKCLGSYSFFKTSWGQRHHSALSEDVCFFSNIRQTNVCEMTLPFYQQKKTGLSAVCVGALHFSGKQRWPNFQTYHRTFSLRMPVAQVPHQREQNGNSRELTWQERHA